MRTEIIFSKSAEKNLKRLPLNIKLKVLSWIESVFVDGLAFTRKSVSLHDEPLQGGRQGQRSIRLNRSYRLIYTTYDSESLQVIKILEITHHVY